MRKNNSHFSEQPLYGRVIKLLYKSKILAYSRDAGGDRGTARNKGYTVSAASHGPTQDGSRDISKVSSSMAVSCGVLQSNF